MFSIPAKPFEGLCPALPVKMNLRRQCDELRWPPQGLSHDVTLAEWQELRDLKVFKKCHTWTAPAVWLVWPGFQTISDIHWCWGSFVQSIGLMICWMSRNHPKTFASSSNNCWKPKYHPLGALVRSSWLTWGASHLVIPRVLLVFLSLKISSDRLSQCTKMR